MSQNADDKNPLDPLGVFQNLRGASLDSWARMMSQVVRSEDYAKAFSTLLDSYVSTSAPARKLIETHLTAFVRSDAYAEATRAVLDAYMQSAAPFRQAMTEMMRSEAFSQALSSLLDDYLANSKPFREAISKAVVQSLTQSLGSGGAGFGKLAERLDPLGFGRALAGSSMESWASLTGAAPFRQALTAAMTQVLTQLNMPTRDEVADLAARLDRIEAQLTRIESRLKSQ
jgi:hypothetical protein